MNDTDKVLFTCKPKFQKKATNFPYKNEPQELVFARVLYMGFGVSSRYFCQQLYWNPPNNTLSGEITRKRKVKQFLCRFPFSTPIHDEPYHLLDTLAFQWIRICSTFCDFPVREKVEISSIHAHVYFSGKYSSSTDFLEFYSLPTQPFHAWLITEFIS